MHKFSLITTTRGRIDFLERLLLSLKEQRFRSLELILVDQTEGEELDSVLDRFQGSFPIHRIRVASCGISVARNEGLRHVQGSIVAFPDDDCAYPPDLLEQVFQILEDDGVLDGVSCAVRDDRGNASAGGIMQRNPGEVSVSNVWKTTVSCSFFVRHSVVETIGDFDEQLGVGAESGCWSGEETDYILRVVRAGKKMGYRPDLHVFHPQPDFAQVGGIRKAFRYGCGAGRVLRKHHYPGWFVAASVGFQLLRVVLELICFRPQRCVVRLAMAAGRMRGR
jgi:glycosyltransferase involved in cell wall biosynthesis